MESRARGVHRNACIGGADFFKKMGVKGLPPQKLLSFDPLVNCIIRSFPPIFLDCCCCRPHLSPPSYAYSPEGKIIK